MTGILVPDRLTPLSTTGLLRAVAGAHRRVLASLPTPECLAIIGGQASLETFRGQKIHGNNPGNKKKPADWEGKYAQFQCDELFDAQTAALAKKLDPAHCIVTRWKETDLYRCILFPPHPWSSFVCFDTPEEGFEDFLVLHSCTDRYKAAWHLARLGDAAGFARALGAAHYYTAPVETYAAGVVSLQRELLPAARLVVAGDATELDDERVGAIDSLVALTISDAIVWNHDRHHEELAA